jgi:hypothetical protein
VQVREAETPAIIQNLSELLAPRHPTSIATEMPHGLLRHLAAPCRIPKAF